MGYSFQYIMTRVIIRDTTGQVVSICPLDKFPTFINEIFKGKESA